jgi:hypothetical protein
MSIGKRSTKVAAVQVEVKIAPTTAEPWERNLRVIDGGLELMWLAWPSLKQVFSV